MSEKEETAHGLHSHGHVTAYQNMLAGTKTYQY